MRLKNTFVLLIAVILFGSCTLQTQISRSYKGRPISVVTNKMGNPTRQEELSGGKVIRIYEKSKQLSAAPINTGQFQYDRFESPKSIKNEVYMFYVDSSGVVEDVKYKCTYSR